MKKKDRRGRKKKRKKESRPQIERNREKRDENVIEKIADQEIILIIMCLAILSTLSLKPMHFL